MVLANFLWFLSKNILDPFSKFLSQTIKLKRFHKNAVLPKKSDYLIIWFLMKFHFWKCKRIYISFQSYDKNYSSKMLKKWEGGTILKAAGVKFTDFHPLCQQVSLFLSPYWVQRNNWLTATKLWYPEDRYFHLQHLIIMSGLLGKPWNVLPIGCLFICLFFVCFYSSPYISLHKSL